MTKDGYAIGYPAIIECKKRDYAIGYIREIEYIDRTNHCAIGEDSKEDKGDE